MTTTTTTKRRSNRTATEKPADALARIQQGFSRNDVTVIQILALLGVDPDDIDPRENVLTFNAWKAKGRRVAKGASSIRVPVYVPRDGKRDDANEPAESTNGSSTDKKSASPRGMIRKHARLFHISQTVPADAPKGTRPEAWWNPSLVKPGTYEATPADLELIEAKLAEAKAKAEQFQQEQDRATAEAIEAQGGTLEIERIETAPTPEPEPIAEDAAPETLPEPAPAPELAGPLQERRQINIMDLVKQKHDAGARQRVAEFKATQEQDRTARTFHGASLFAAR